jgi:hypothetical protein
MQVIYPWLELLAACLAAALAIMFIVKLRTAARSPIALPETVSTTAAVPAASLAKTTVPLTLAASSCAVFKPGAGVRILQMTTPVGPMDVQLSTGYVDGWGHVEHGIAAMVKGFTGGAEEAGLAGSLADLLAALCISANAWVGDFASSAKNSQTACFQPAIGQIRELDETATGAFLDRLGVHPRATELWKVLHCYREALAHWTPEEQPVALAKLHEGCLTLSDSLILFLCESRGVKESEVAKSYGVGQTELPERALEAELYRNDVICFQSARVAWQASLPHSSSVIENPAYPPQDAHVTAARYLRSAIFRVLEVEEPHRAVLLGPPFDEPLGVSFSGTSEPGFEERALKGLATNPNVLQFDRGSGT